MYDGAQHTDRLYDGAQHTVYAYNKAGALTSTIYPDAGVLALAVDAMNRVTRRTDQRNIALDFTYDSMGRLLTKKQGTSVYWSFTYATDSQLTEAKKARPPAVPRLAKASTVTTA